MAAAFSWSQINADGDNNHSDYLMSPDSIESKKPLLIMEVGHQHDSCSSQFFLVIYTKGHPEKSLPLGKHSFYTSSSTNLEGLQRKRTCS